MSARKPVDITLKPYDQGGEILTFATFDYDYGSKSKPVDGRIYIKTRHKITEGHSSGPSHTESMPEVAVDLQLNTCFYGFGSKELEKLGRWALNAAAWVRQTHLDRGMKED